MLSLKAALQRILEQSLPLGHQELSLGDLIHQNKNIPFVLAKEIYSDRFVPPTDNSAMDGFAALWEDCQQADPNTPVRLSILGEIKPGQCFSKTLSKGKAIRIFTGASIPKGVDLVIPIENTCEPQKGWVEICSVKQKGQNIRRKGEDIQKNDVIFKKGDYLNPATLGTLASLGVGKVTVFKKPKVSFFATGDELIELKDKPKGSQIVDSNSYTLGGLLSSLGMDFISLGIARDQPKEITNKMMEAFERSDVLITCGGISVGNYDYIQSCFKSLGGNIDFWKVAIKPGKPFAYGHLNGKPLFALPGNPVTVAITFEQLVRPSFLKMMGYQAIYRPMIKAKTMDDLKGSKERTCFVRVLIQENENQRKQVFICQLVGKQGSHILTSMAKANGLAVLKKGIEKINKGEKVWVQPLWPFCSFRDKINDSILE